MMIKHLKKTGLVVGTGLMVYGGNAMAAIPVPDVTEGVSFIEGLAVPLSLLGAAFLTIGILVKGWKIMRSV